MTSRMMILFAAATMMSIVSPLLAHEEFRVVGVVTSREATQFVVKTREGKSTSIELNKQTVVTRDKKKVDASEIKVGRTVVVDAYGDSERDLLALEVQLVPAIASAK
jgi:hypothetical protein